MNEKLDVLSHYFGYSSFRPGQEEMIDSVLAGRDACGVMPTGAGKSLCYQVPALLLPGVTLVVSPLISLMRDQVTALKLAGVPAAYLNSSLTLRQYRAALDNARDGAYKIIYVAPERLAAPDFLSFAQQAQISMVTVDEAHCVSQWGQNFRPSYLLIPDFLQALPTRPVVSAFTATATPRVREDIVTLLGLRDPFVLLTGFDRTNLYFEVQKPRDKLAAACRIVEENAGQSGILYCATRKTVEEVCQELQRRGYAATRYHAGLTDQERRDNQEAFLYDRCPVMVATNAFGMGIDKSNVSYVIHYNMPKDLESYYQEAGRAGRDGQPARCILLYSGQDVITNQFLLDRAEDNQSLEPEQRELVRQQDRERLRAMTFYCHTTDCLRAYLLRYFGEQAPGYCGNCFNCNHLFEEIDITTEAQKILSCVARTGQRYGVKLICDVLRGAKTERIARLGLEGQSTYGLMSGCKENRLREIIRFLELNGCLSSSGGEYPVLRLGPKARQALAPDACLRMKLAKEAERPKPAPAAPSTKDGQLYALLRELRAEIAKEQGVPAYLVFSNATLDDMSARQPRTPADFLEVSGVGKAKLERYGARFMAAIRTYLDQP